ncbi:MAG: class I SAM-dependent methyltransferase [Acidobacteriota bacterium]
MKFYSGERDYPEDKKTNPRFQRELSAYLFCVNYVENKFVLDAGCGEGFGSFHLAQKSKKVIGIDNSRKTIEKAKQTYRKDNLEFMMMDVTHMEFPDEYFDVVISLAVIEHIEDYETYLKEIKRVLKKEGTGIISFLNKLYKFPLEPYHYREFNLVEINELMERYFSDIEIFGIFGTSKNSISYRKKRLKIIDLVYKSGFFKLLRLTPRKLSIIIYEILHFLFREFLFLLKSREIMKISTEDFLISKENLENAINYIAVFRKL